MAPILASYVNDFFIHSESIKERRFQGELFTIDDLPLWFTLYQNIENLSAPIIDFIKTNISLDSNIVHDHLALREKLLQFSISEYNNDSSTPSEYELKFVQLFQSFTQDNPHIFQFFIFSLIPCLVFYKMTPFQLYNLASSGDAESIKKLLRLDTSLLHDPVIGAQIQKFLFTERKEYRSILAATLEPLSINMTIQNIKYNIAGELSLISELLGKRLKERDIRAFFQAVSWDKQGAENDPDIPEKRSSLTRAITRSRSSLTHSFNTGQEFLNVLSGFLS